MKTKFVLFVLVVFFSTFFNGTVLAYRDTYCEKIDKLSQYQGFLGDLNKSNREFEMLKESTETPNFEHSIRSLMHFLNCLSKDNNIEVLRQKPDCNAFAYIKKLLNFYKVYEDEIKENVATVSLTTANEIDLFMERLKKEFVEVDHS